MKLFLDSSVVLAACGRAGGASRLLFDAAGSNDWTLQVSSYVVNEVGANIDKLNAGGIADWSLLRAGLQVVPDIVSFPWTTVLLPAKDRPILFTASAWSDVLLTLYARDFGEVLGTHFYGLPILKPGDFLSARARRRSIQMRFNAAARYRFLAKSVALLVATAIWLPALHLFFQPPLKDFRQTNAVAPAASELAAGQLNLWENPELRAREIAAMRGTNAEWDFMGRTFLVLSLANMAIDQPAQQDRYLKVIDSIIDETLNQEQSRGMFFFMMDYAKSGRFRAKPPRSTFLDGELALMFAARQLVKPEPRYAPLLAQRVDYLVQYMSRGPVMCGESYPDECWMFCNAAAIAAIHVSDKIDGRDHSAFIAHWLATIKAKLIHPQSGLLISTFTYDGQPIYGPEGSSLWMVDHCLKLVDPEFAAEQYKLAKEQIGRSILGFGYAQEWPHSWVGPMDVDSGPIVPVVNASAGSSGLAVLGAASFGDDDYLRQLVTTLRFGAFPISGNGQLRFAASNQVGDAVLLYSLVQGPLWDRAESLREKQK